MTIDGAWTITPHAARRISARRLQPEHLLAALAKPGAAINRRRKKYYDKRSKTVVVVDEQDSVIVTAYRMRPRPKKMKRQARGS